MNRFHAKKPASKTHESKKTKPKAATAPDAPVTSEPQPPDRTPSDDGTTGIDDIIRQRQAEKQGRDEQTISGDTE